jgi:5-methylcytosine-specific restriction endonuclease McrA
MWCPSCKSIKTCKAVPGASVTYSPSDYGQRWSHEKHGDLHWFQRGRECLVCGNRFLTGEMNIDYLFELTELRDALSEVKANAEAYSVESAKAAGSLNKLSKSLKILRALKIYKDAS